jgi:drug/metabolite transporter (DMT)-like permease
MVADLAHQSENREPVLLRDDLGGKRTREEASQLSGMDDGYALDDRRPAGWMITAAFCFASMGALTHAVGPRCDWLLIALFRILCTFVFSMGLAWLGRARLVLWSPRTLWIRSGAGTISLLCSFYALTRLPVADVLTLTNTYPLWIVLISLRQVRRSDIGVDLLCVCAGVLGVVLIQRPYLSGQANIAVLVALLGSITTAIAMLGLHRLRDVDARAVVAHFSGLASLILGLWVSLHPRQASSSSFDGSTLLLLLGVGATGTVGQVLITRAFASGPPSRISVLSLTQVVFAMGFDMAIEGRVLTASTLAGFLLVLGPTAWISLQAGPIVSQTEANM